MNGKDNYAVLGTYLTNDGSLIQNAADPGLSCICRLWRIRKITKNQLDSKMVWNFEYSNDTDHAHHDFTVMRTHRCLRQAESLIKYLKPDYGPVRF